MKFKLHGNYCGPGWSGGKYRKDGSYDVPSVDSWDESCRRHDSLIGQGKLLEADIDFLKSTATVGNPMGPFPILYHGLTRQHGTKRKPKFDDFDFAKKRKINEMAGTNRKYSGKRKRSIYSNGKQIKKIKKNNAKTKSKTGSGSNRKSSSVRSTKSNVSRRLVRPRKKSGIVYEFENGSAVAEAQTTGNNVSQTLFVGHSTANMQKQMLVFWTVAVKMLLQKAGYDVTELNSSYQDIRIHLVYDFSGNAVQATYDTVTVNRTVKSFATELRDTFDTATTDIFHFKQMALRQDSTDATDLATISMDRLIINYEVLSTLKVQNTTPSATGLDSTDNNGTNPLHAVKYSVNQGFLSLSSVASNQSDPFANSFAAGFADGNGFIDFYQQQLPSSGSIRQDFGNLPSKKAFTHCKSSTKTTLSPGAIIMDKAMYKKSMYFNTLFVQTEGGAVDSLANVSKYGKCSIIGLSKVIDNRTEKQAPETSVELTQRFMGSGFLRPLKYTAPDRNVVLPVY